MLLPLLSGFVVGVAAAALAAWFILRHHLRRVRAAERRARAAERMAEIGAMTGGLAHEIKNPLSTIGLNAQLLLEAIQDLDVPDDDRRRLANRVGSLRRESERLRGTLADFLEYAGQVHLDRRPVDLNALVDELVDFYLPEAERHGVRLRADPDAEPVVADVDPKLVKQSLLNLMLNATQAMAAPPAVASPIPPAGDRAKELILRTETGKDADGRRTACIHVIDTGPGIAPETLAKVFSPYFTTKAGGSGLGLPTSRRLIEEHGGRIDVHSEPGRGSDFVVVLPVDRPSID